MTGATTLLGHPPRTFPRRCNRFQMFGTGARGDRAGPAQAL